MSITKAAAFEYSTLFYVETEKAALIAYVEDTGTHNTMFDAWREGSTRHLRVWKLKLEFSQGH